MTLIDVVQVFHVIHHLSFTPHATYIVAFNCESWLKEKTEPEVYKAAKRSFEMWLWCIAYHAEGAPIFVVGTHSTTLSRRTKVEMSLEVIRIATKCHHSDECIQRDTRTSLSFWAVDNLEDGTEGDYDAIREKLAACIDNGKHLMEDVPHAWIEVADEVAAAIRSNKAIDATAVAAGTASASPPETNALPKVEGSTPLPRPRGQLSKSVRIPKSDVTADKAVTASASPPETMRMCSKAQLERLLQKKRFGRTEAADRTETESMLRWLKNLGVVAHFPQNRGWDDDNPNIFLDAQHLMNMLGCFLRNVQCRNPCKIFTTWTDSKSAS